MRHKANILIVDDNPGMVRTTMPVFEHKGYVVTTAADGLEAIERVQESPFDVILMDILMPHMDGIRAYREIRAISPEVVVLLMSAYAVHDRVEEALREGVREVFQKPLDLEEVIALIEEIREERGHLS